MMKLFGRVADGVSNTTLISQGTVIQGSVLFSGVLEIEGQVNGDITAVDGAEAVLRIMQSGKVIGNVNVPLVIVDGAVTGTICSTSHIDLAANAVVVGDVYYSLVEMMRGAQVNGKLVFRDSVLGVLNQDFDVPERNVSMHERNSSSQV